MRHGTYSIVALDPDTGELGAAVQSHWFSVGSLCTWARPGVGAVATQSVVEPAHGPNALDRLADGASAREALDALLAADPLAAMRQVGIVDVQGGVAVATGPDCIAHAGDATGATWSCQANMMERDTVPAAMSAAFEVATGDLAARLLTALQAAQGEGGDVRGRQSAALLVVPSEGESWRARVDLRVEDHDDPLAEMERLLGLWRAYELAGAADELLFWAGLAIAHAGELDEGVEAVRRAAQAQPNWLVLLDRLSPDFAPAGAAVRAALGRD